MKFDWFQCFGRLRNPFPVFQMMEYVISTQKWITQSELGLRIFKRKRGTCPCSSHLPGHHIRSWEHCYLKLKSPHTTNTRCLHNRSTNISWSVAAILYCEHANLLHRRVGRISENGVDLSGANLLRSSALPSCKQRVPETRTRNKNVRAAQQCQTLTPVPRSAPI